MYSKHDENINRAFLDYFSLNHYKSKNPELKNNYLIDYFHPYMKNFNSKQYKKLLTELFAMSNEIISSIYSVNNFSTIDLTCLDTLRDHYVFSNRGVFQIKEYELSSICIDFTLNLVGLIPNKIKPSRKDLAPLSDHNSYILKGKKQIRNIGKEKIIITSMLNTQIIDYFFGRTNFNNLIYNFKLLCEKEMFNVY